MIRTSFVHNLDNVPWMDDLTRSRAKDKALAITKKIAYPDWIMDPVKLDEHYENVNIYLATWIFLMKNNFCPFWRIVQGDIQLIVKLL